MFVLTFAWPKKKGLVHPPFSDIYFSCGLRWMDDTLNTPLLDDFYHPIVILLNVP